MKKRVNRCFSRNVSKALIDKSYVFHPTSQSKKPSDPQTCHSEFLEKPKAPGERPPNLEQQLHPNGGSFPGIHDRFLRNLVVCWHWIYRVGIPIRKFRRCEKGGWLISTPQTRSLGDELKLWYMEVPGFGSLNGMLG